MTYPDLLTEIFNAMEALDPTDFSEPVETADDITVVGTASEYHQRLYTLLKRADPDSDSLFQEVPTQVMDTILQSLLYGSLEVEFNLLDNDVTAIRAGWQVGWKDRPPQNELLSQMQKMFGSNVVVMDIGGGGEGCGDPNCPNCNPQGSGD